MKILLLSPYDAMSHRYWRNTLEAQFPEHQWVILSMAARYFSWRIRGNSLSYAFEHRETLEQDYDLLIATSMTDLSALRGMSPGLADIPTLVYFHENQFAYPDSEQAYSTVEAQILNLYTALSADRIAFNSSYNRESFLNGAEALLTRLPDHVPLDCLRHINEHSEILPVPITITPTSPSSKFTPTDAPLQILWNHRWEYDKGPEILFECVQQLKQQSALFTMHIVGQQFRQQPDVFAKIKAQLGDHLGRWGFIENKVEYQHLLQQSDVVLSTAIHDFQGIAVLEAVAAGCIPLVPDRLAYQELFAPDFRYASSLTEHGGNWKTRPKEEGAAISTQLLRYIKDKTSNRLPAAPDLKKFGWPHLKTAYRSAFEATINSFEKRRTIEKRPITPKGAT